MAKIREDEVFKKELWDFAGLLPRCRKCMRFYEDICLDEGQIPDIHVVGDQCPIIRQALANIDRYLLEHDFDITSA